MLVARMIITAGRISLPDLDQGARYAATILVEHAAAYDDTFAEGICTIVVANVGGRAECGSRYDIPSDAWACDFRQRLYEPYRLMRGCALSSIDVRRRSVERLDPGHLGPIASRCSHWIATFKDAR